jgi:Dolichyl-phosphate-mannose-protein mannosyltransferase
VSVHADRRDLAWAGILAASFLSGLAVSWQRWANPLIDCGREMNLPLRLAHGELLYADVRHLYGPLSPYLHALLFRAFGPSLDLLYVDGVVSTVVALAAIYWLGRRIMSPLAAGTAALGVMWLCAFKPAGNYLLPYSFNALHGTVLGLLTVVLLVRALATGGGPALAGAGVIAGLTLLAKIEMGAAAVAAGLVTAVLVGYPQSRGTLARVALFLGPALGLALGGYVWLGVLVGWRALADDNYLLLYNVPPALAHYNAWISGLDHPLHSVSRMIIAVVKLGVLGALIGAVSLRVAAGRQTSRQPARAASIQWLGGALVVLLVVAFTTGLDWDTGPYLAMPFLLGGLTWWRVGRLRREVFADTATRLETRTLIVFAVYGLVSLGRMLLHVRSGGAYGSYLLPMSVVLFTYLWAEPFGDWLEGRGASRVGATIAVGLVLADAILTAGLLGYRYRTRYQTAIRTGRGTLVAEPAVGQAWNEALAFIASRTVPGDAVAVMPEGTSLDFLSGRRNPLREEITTPGLLDGRFEVDAIARLDASAAPLILIANRPTAEFGPAAFGRDYAVALMRWIEANYLECAMFGPLKDSALRIGDRPFFIRAYCRRPG